MKTSTEVLEDYRESFDVQDAKDYNTSMRSAYSMANYFCGACIDTFCGIKQLFNTVYGVDCDAASRTIYQKLTGNTLCYAEVEEALATASNINPMLLVLTPPCPDFSTGNPNPKGTSGDKGGHLLKAVPTIVNKMFISISDDPISI